MLPANFFFLVRSYFVFFFFSLFCFVRKRILSHFPCFFSRFICKFSYRIYSCLVHLVLVYRPRLPSNFWFFFLAFGKPFSFSFEVGYLHNIFSCYLLDINMEFDCLEDFTQKNINMNWSLIYPH